MENAFSKVMESRLGQCDALKGNRVEVVNFGVSGYGTAQELIVLRERVWKYQPDMIILTITTNNDIVDNSKALKKTAIPYFELRDGRLEMDDSFRESSAFRLRRSLIGRAGTWVSNNLRTIQALRRGWVSVRHLTSAVTGSSQNAEIDTEPSVKLNDVPIGDVGIDNAVYLEPGDLNWTSAWQASEALIEQIHTEVAAKGSKFLVVTLSNGIQVWPDKKVRDEFARRVGSTDLLYPDKRINMFCKSKGIDAFMLAPKLAEYAEANNTFLHGFDLNIGNGHWNTQGHRVAGEILASDICARILPAGH